MTATGFTRGAHLLMWVFPLVVVVLAVMIYVFGGRRRGDRR